MGRLRTLEATNCIDVEQRAYLERATMECAERTGLKWPVVAVVCWSLIVLVMANRSWLLAPGKVGTVALYVGAALAVFCAVWSCRRPMHFAPVLSRRQNAELLALGVIAAVAAVLISDPLARTVQMGTQWASQRAFKADRELMLKEPGAFPMLRHFARHYYGVDVFLAEAGDAWATTSTFILGSSPASMLTMPGYCHLNISRRSVFMSFDGEDSLKEPFVQGVMIHELAHCLDIRRDLARAPMVSTFSIAPEQAAKVVDLVGYMAATDAPETKRWREVLADIFAVGYWRQFAAADADALTARLAKKRTEAAAGDPEHATTCWILAAQKAPAPAGPADLLHWSDSLRSRTRCSLG